MGSHWSYFRKSLMESVERLDVKNIQYIISIRVHIDIGNIFENIREWRY